MIVGAGLGGVVASRGRAAAGRLSGYCTLDAFVAAGVADGCTGVFAVGAVKTLDAFATAQADRRGARARGIVATLALAALALAGRPHIASQRATAAVVKVAIHIKAHHHVLAAARRHEARPRAVINDVVAVVVFGVADLCARVDRSGSTGQKPSLLVKRRRNFEAFGDREVIDLAAVTARHGARDTLTGLYAADLAVLF